MVVECLKGNFFYEFNQTSGVSWAKLFDWRVYISDLKAFDIEGSSLRKSLIQGKREN